MVSAIDPQAIEDLRAMNPGDDSFLRELIQIYLEDSPARIVEIEQSLNRVTPSVSPARRTASRAVPPTLARISCVRSASRSSESAAQVC